MIGREGHRLLQFLVAPVGCAGLYLHETTRTSRIGDANRKPMIKVRKTILCTRIGCPNSMPQ